MKQKMKIQAGGPGRRVLRIGTVAAKTGLSAPTIYRYMRDGIFPRSVPLGPLAKGWLESEIENWLDARLAERDRGAEDAA